MAKLQAACQILGIRDESCLAKFSKEDIEKIRKKTKEVYKASQKEGKRNKANQFLDAWKLVDAHFLALAKRAREKDTRKPPPKETPRPENQNGQTVIDSSAANKRKAEVLDEAAKDREKAAALKRAAEKAAMAKSPAEGPGKGESRAPRQ